MSQKVLEFHFTICLDDATLSYTLTIIWFYGLPFQIICSITPNSLCVHSALCLVFLLLHGISFVRLSGKFSEIMLLQVYDI